MEAHPILVLIDIGGTLLYRCSGNKLTYPMEKEGGKLKEVKLDFSIKRHHHYYRQYMQDFLSRLLTHPRVKLAFYSSITRRNLMPLLSKILEIRQLKPVRSKIFEAFDQEYCA